MLDKENHINNFLDHLWLEFGLSRNTLSAYKSDLELLTKFLLKRKLKLLSLKEVHLSDYFDSLGNRSANTRARHLSTLKRFFGYLLTSGLIVADPSSALKQNKSGRRLPKTLSEDDVFLLLSAPNTNDDYGVRDRAMLELTYAAGLRVSELVALELDSVNLKQGVLRIMGKGKKERLVPVGDEAIFWLKRYITKSRGILAKENHSNAVFLSRLGLRMSRQSFWHLVKKYCILVGLKETVSPHTLRHCFATHLVNNDADLRIVQTLLGHSDISTTQIYTFVASERLKKIHQIHHPRG